MSIPEYKCKNCGKFFFGWGVGKFCQVCGGRLEALNESAKGREISEEEKAK